MDFNPPKTMIMTATNINVEEFINVLQTLRARGFKLIDLDMLPDENHPSMNKLVVNPVPTEGMNQTNYQQPEKTEIRNPNISRDNNDIFSSFNL